MLNGSLVRCAGGWYGAGWELCVGQRTAGTVHATRRQRSPDARRGLVDRTLYMEEAVFARSMPRINRAQVLVAFSVCSWGVGVHRTALCAIRKARDVIPYGTLLGTGYWRCLLKLHMITFFIEFYR